MAATRLLEGHLRLLQGRDDVFNLVDGPHNAIYVPQCWSFVCCDFHEHLNGPLAFLLAKASFSFILHV